MSHLPPETGESDRKRLQATLSIQCRKFDEGERLLKELTSENTAQSWGDLAGLYLQQNRPDEADHSVKRGLAVAPDDARLLWLSGTIRMSSGKSGEPAFADLAKASAAKEIGPDAREIVEAFRNYRTDSDDTRVVSDLEAVTRRYPTSLKAWQLLVGLHRQARRQEQAVKAAITAAQLIPADARAAQLATETLAEAQRLDEADRMAARWRELAPADAMVIDVVQARIKCIRGQVKEALKLLDAHKDQIESAAAEKPGDVEVYAAALAAEGRIEDARRLVVDRARASPAWGIRYLRISGVLMTNPDAARTWLADLSIETSSPADLVSAAAQAWFSLGLAETKQERPDQAIADFDQAQTHAQHLAAMPGQEGTGSMLLASIYMARNQSDRAIEAYRIAVAKLPESADALNNLAYLLEQKSDGISEAAVLARRALDLAAKQRLPDSTRSHFLETLGIAELRLGNFAAAQAAFQAGLDIDPNAADLAIGLAESLIGLNRRQDAQRLVDQIARLTPPRQELDPRLKVRLDVLRDRLAAQK